MLVAVNLSFLYFLHLRQSTYRWKVLFANRCEFSGERQRKTRNLFKNRRKRSSPSTTTVVKLINTLQKLACRREQGLAATSRQQAINKHKEASFRGHSTPSRLGLRILGFRVLGFLVRRKLLASAINIVFSWGYAGSTLGTLGKVMEQGVVLFGTSWGTH
jgi:hypothetical protein